MHPIIFEFNEWLVLIYFTLQCASILFYFSDFVSCVLAYLWLLPSQVQCLCTSPLACFPFHTILWIDPSSVTFLATVCIIIDEAQFLWLKNARYL